MATAIFDSNTVKRMGVLKIEELLKLQAESSIERFGKFRLWRLNKSTLPAPSEYTAKLKTVLAICRLADASVRMELTHEELELLTLDTEERVITP